jgi:hypothetical protein
MTFSNYHFYVELVRDRDHAILGVTMVVLLVFVILGYVRWLRPGRFRPAAWLLGVGGFYATLALWVVYIFSHTPAG